MILITGASGNVGSQVLKQLSATGAKLRAMYRNQQAAASAPKGIEVAIADFAKPEELKQALRGVEKLFLLCAPVPELPQLEANAVDAAKSAGVKHIVKLSAIGAGEGAHTFARGHQAAERKLRESGIAYTFLRPNGFMENFLLYTGTLQSQGAFYGSGSESPVSYIDVRDIAAVTAKALTSSGHENKIYELTGPEGLSNSDVAAKIGAAVGKPVKFVRVPEAQARQSMISTGMPEWTADAILDLQYFYDAGKAAAVSKDVERVTGRKAISFDQFVRDFRDAFRGDTAAAS
jgi:uncharacterized protein YbjT (DUF2867 family)